MRFESLRCGDVLISGKQSIIVSGIYDDYIFGDRGAKYSCFDLENGEWTISRKTMDGEWIVGTNRFLSFRNAIIEIMKNQSALLYREAGETDPILFAPPFMGPIPITHRLAVSLVASAAMGFSHVVLNRAPAGTFEYRDYLYREDDRTFAYREDRYTSLAGEHEAMLERLKGNTVVKAKPL